MNKRSSTKRHSENPTASRQTPPPGSLGTSGTTGAIVFIVAACLVCLGYTLYTNQTWEDSLITLRQAENLLHGEGLTYNIGSRVHGFTSPINVLLLALCHVLTGQSSYDATLWLYRVFSIAAFAASGVLMLNAFCAATPRWSAATWFLGIVYLFDVKNVAFSINGMETAFMLLSVAWAVYLMSRAAPEQWLWRGLCWAGLMWSRPDGCVYIAALSLAELIFLSASRRATIISLAKSAAVCLVFYGPWVVWAWSYYGSPIPHTIIAKGNIEQGALHQLLTTFDTLLSGTISIASQIFRPIYYGDTLSPWLPGLWGRMLSVLTEMVGIVALLYFLCPVKDRFGRAMSLCFAIICFYLSYMPFQYPWYFPPAMIFGAVAFSRAAIALTFASEGVTDYLHLRRPDLFVFITLVVLAGGALLEFYPACLEQRVEQLVIETGNRALLGQWLKENGKPSDTVYLEPLGYIGYYSGMQMRDFPGLVSPEVVQIRQQLPPDAQSARIARYLIPGELKPDWVVLRSFEEHSMATLNILGAFEKEYTLAKQFNVQDRLRQYDFLPGRGSLMYDSDYRVYRRNR